MVIGSPERPPLLLASLSGLLHAEASRTRAATPASALDRFFNGLSFESRGAVRTTTPDATHVVDVTVGSLVESDDDVNSRCNLFPARDTDGRVPVLRLQGD